MTCTRCVSQTTGRKALTGVNSDILSQLQMQDVERIVYKGADGWAIDGFFVKPAGWQPGKKYPMVLSIHGRSREHVRRPSGFTNFKVYAARGWAVFFTNPRGSAGYGEKFQRGVDKQWAVRRTTTSCRSGCDSCKVRVDRSRSPGRHRRQLRRVHDQLDPRPLDSLQGRRHTAEHLEFHQHRGHARLPHTVTPAISAEIFGRTSISTGIPRRLKYAKNVKTPTLILHSDNDQRVPLEQGEQWFRALKHYGVTTEFVIFPRENHNLTRNGEPKHLIESLTGSCIGSIDF